MTPSKTLFLFCISFILGITLQSIIKIPQIFLWGFLILGILLIFAPLGLSRNLLVIRRYSPIIGFCILFWVLGILRLQISEFNILSDNLKIFNDNNEKITLLGKVIAEPDVRDTLQKLKIKVDNFDSIILITTTRYPEYEYLDEIKITGKLKSPLQFENFNYKNYLMKDGVYSVMDFPDTELISKKHDYNLFTFLYEKILFLKAKLVQSVNSNLSPPYNSVLQGIVFGNDKNMSKDLKNKFNITGLSHLTAVSGSNIVILISILMIFLLSLGFWRGQAFYFSVFLIWLYIILIGLPVSGIRAVIMGSTALLAEKLGRQNTSSRIIVVSAVLMLFQNPLLLFYDLSFQLSFLASMGIIYLYPIINSFINMFLKDKIKFLSDIISITLSAQIFTLPIIFYNFGTISLISPITNILVLPIIPLLTVLGFLASIFGSISNILGFIFSLPCLFLTMYLLKIIDIFSKPWAVKTFENISWIWPILCYILLIIMIWYLNRKQKPKFLGY